MLGSGTRDSLREPVVKLAYFEGLPEPVSLKPEQTTGQFDVKEILTADGLKARIGEIAGQIFQTLESIEFNLRQGISAMPRDHITCMAFGWLAEEGFHKKYFLGHYMKPSDQPLSEKERELCKKDLEAMFVVPWVGNEASEVQDAMRKAFAYGMHRRRITLDKTLQSEDNAVGIRAGEILKTLARNVPSPTLNSVIDDVCRMDERTHARIPHHEEVFLVAAAVGWLAAEGKVNIKGGRTPGPKGEVTIEWYLGNHAEDNRAPEVEQHAKDITKELKDGVDLTSLMKAHNHELLTAMAVGWLARRDLVDFSAVEGKLVVKSK